jgi:hypothetical protein
VQQQRYLWMLWMARCLVEQGVGLREEGALEPPPHCPCVPSPCRTWNGSRQSPAPAQRVAGRAKRAEQRRIRRHTCV